MPRKSNPVPTYLHHKRSGMAFVIVRAADGRRKQITLGIYGSEKSKKEHARIVAELAASSAPIVVSTPGSSIMVKALILAFLDHAERYYRRPDGTMTNEVTHFKYILAIVKKFYGEVDATNFGPRALDTVRAELVSQGLCRTNINRQIGRVKRMFKWGVSQELIPNDVYQRLSTLAGLQKGRTPARDHNPIRPVSIEDIEKTVQAMTPTLRTMVLLQRFTGMRPGEVCAMRPMDIERGGELWQYRPGFHKMAYRGVPRVILLGPQAREILKPCLDRITNPEEYIFSPRRSREERFEELRKKRKTKVQPSQISRKRPIEELKKIVREKFDTSDYANCIRRAARRVNVPEWSPNQLRHTFATEVRKAHGLEAAQVLLGHTRADVTQIYAERNEKLATEVVEKIG